MMNSKYRRTSVSARVG